MSGTDKGTGHAGRKAGADAYLPPSDAWVRARTGAPLASFQRRAGAIVVDFLIAGVTFIAVTVGLGSLALNLGLIAPADDVNLKFTFFRNWYSVVWLVLYFTLWTWLDRGRTPGKRLAGIRVVSLAHERLSFWHSLERALGYGASALEAGFGFFQYFIRPDRRTVHDRIAETIVIAEPRRPRRTA